MTTHTATAIGPALSLRLSTDRDDEPAADINTHGAAYYRHRADHPEIGRAVKRFTSEAHMMVRLAAGSDDIGRWERCVRCAVGWMEASAFQPDRIARVRALSEDRPIVLRHGERDQAATLVVVGHDAAPSEGFDTLRVSIGEHRFLLIDDDRDAEAIRSIGASAGRPAFVVDYGYMGYPDESRCCDSFAEVREHVGRMDDSARAATVAIIANAFRLIGLDLPASPGLDDLEEGWAALNEDEAGWLSGAAMTLASLTPRREDEARGRGPA